MAMLLATFLRFFDFWDFFFQGAKRHHTHIRIRTHSSHIFDAFPRSRKNNQTPFPSYFDFLCRGRKKKKVVPDKNSLCYKSTRATTNHLLPPQTPMLDFISLSLSRLDIISGPVFFFWCPPLLMSHFCLPYYKKRYD